MAILRRIFGEIRRRFGVTQDIPNTSEKLREELPGWLGKASARLFALATTVGEGSGERAVSAVAPRFILILDALNQLEDKDAAPHLGWLPEYFPANVRVVVSTLPGPSLDALMKRSWPSLAFWNMGTGPWCGRGAIFLRPCTRWL